jgi:hypothetical protein
MWFMFLRMLSSASLSAFTASVQARAREAVPLGGVVPVRAQSDARPGNGVRIVPPQQASSGSERLSPPDRDLPRGSLLDLSV